MLEMTGTSDMPAAAREWDCIRETAIPSFYKYDMLRNDIVVKSHSSITATGLFLLHLFVPLGNLEQVSREQKSVVQQKLTTLH